MVRLLVRVSLAGALVMALGTPASMRGLQPDAGPVQVVDVLAERFSFTPSEIRVKAGTTVEFRLRSDDTNHGFHVIGTPINVRLPKRGRGVTTVRFRADTPGTYVFECSKLCGAGHNFMRGALIVTE